MDKFKKWLSAVLIMYGVLYSIEYHWPIPPNALGVLIVISVIVLALWLQDAFKVGN